MKCVFHFEINLVESILAGRIIFLPYFLRRVSRDVFKLSFLSSIHWNIEYWTLSVVVRFLALRRIERIFSLVNFSPFLISATTYNERANFRFFSLMIRGRMDLFLMNVPFISPYLRFLTIYLLDSLLRFLVLKPRAGLPQGV